MLQNFSKKSAISLLEMVPEGREMGTIIRP